MFMRCSEKGHIERWFRELEDGTKRLYNNLSAKTLKTTEELAKTISLSHNMPL